MEISTYNRLQSSENKNQIAIDFDGVIHKNSLGFYDGTVYDTPVDGSLEAILALYNRGYEIIIFTCKAKSDRPLVNGKTGTDLIKDWLADHGFLKYIKEVTSEKPRAIAYIDDKGIRFTNWKDTIEQLNEITN